MYILGIHNGHDAAACLFHDTELVAFCKEERLTRVKNDGKRFALAAIDEVLRISGIDREHLDAVWFTRKKLPLGVYRQVPLHKRIRDLARRYNGRNRDLTLESEMFRHRQLDEKLLIDEVLLRRSMGLRADAEIGFVNHDYGHVLGAFRFTDWPADALYLSCDGGGEGTQYSAYHFDGNRLELLLGGDRCLFEAPQNPGASIGLVYAYTTEYLGFKSNRHEGKVTGLAAFGEPVKGAELAAMFDISPSGEVQSRLRGVPELAQFLRGLYGGLSREQVAASVQRATEEVVLRWAARLMTLRPTRYLGLAGGVFANVLLNQKLAELPGVEEVFIFPPMSDEGLAVGAALDCLVRRLGITGLTRGRLRDTYLGYPYAGEDLLALARQTGAHCQPLGETAPVVAQLLAQGFIGALYCARMEMGPRALGARSILAAPVDRSLNDELNRRLERTEFMPFAPYVLDEDAERVFFIDRRNREACRFMTITTGVRPEFRDRIPAVVHVDGTARPQIVTAADNPLYYAILKAYRDLTGVPCLVNTSFNAHEEPIINTPGEALAALGAGRIDFLVCEAGLVVSDTLALRARHIFAADNTAAAVAA